MTDAFLRRRHLINRALGQLHCFLRFLPIMFCFIALCGCQLIKGAKTDQDIVQVKNPCIAMALPTSGPYATIAGKIRKGAELAKQELRKQDIQVQLKNINTTATDWLKQLANLPPEYAVVGGPLQDKNYLALRNAGMLQQRVYFAFLPTLAQGDEGKTAWRFFPSQQDQIDALINFATDQLNIRTYGALYPGDNYGKRMTALLENVLGKRHMKLQKATYNPSVPTSMGPAVKTLVNSHISPESNQLVPQTAFEAMFVPDSWKRMNLVTKTLRENGEDRLVLLGPSIWEQGLAGKAVPGERYSLAVFPSPYSSARAPAAVRNAGNDLWTAMGYDFVKFGARLALGARPANASQITILAQSASSAITALAPIRWDNSGMGHETMYLFQVNPTGIVPLNVENFRKARQSIAEQAALRMQGFGHIDPDTGVARDQGAESGVALPPEEMPKSQPVNAVPEPEMEQNVQQPVRHENLPVAQPAAAQPQSQSGSQPAVQRRSSEEGIMRTTPRSSYKLSLPTR